MATKKPTPRKPRIPAAKKASSCAIKRALRTQKSKATTGRKPLRTLGPLKELRQEKFCQMTLEGGSARAAAIRAGYAPKAAAQQASRLLTNVKIRRRICELLQSSTLSRRIMRRKDMLKQLSDHAQWSISDLLKYVGTPATKFAEICEQHPAGRWVRKVEFDVKYDHGSQTWSESYVKKLEMEPAHPSRMLLADLMGWAIDNNSFDAAGGQSLGVIIVPESRIAQIREAPRAIPAGGEASGTGDG